MTPGDAARVLAAAALYDNRTIAEADAAAWHAVIGDLDAADALESVRRHYRDSTERLMPAHVRAGVRAIRNERPAPAEARALPSPFEDDINRRIRTRRGVATARQILGPILERLAQERPAPAAAIEQLRAITAGPAWTPDPEERP